MNTIKDNLQSGKNYLSHLSTPSLDAELLLAHTLNVSRIYLHTWPENTLTIQQQKDYENLLNKRAQGIPIAYLIGKKEFWSLSLKVTKDTLVPRPETELLVSTILNLLPKNSKQYVADLGTGSGAIAMAIATERPNWEIIATDISAAALKVAKENAATPHIKNIEFYHGDWCQALPDIRFNAIVSNPPYITLQDPCLKHDGVKHEPSLALVSLNNGLQDIENISNRASDFLYPGGYLCLEHSSEQGQKVSNLLKRVGFCDINTYQDYNNLDRATCGKVMNI